MLSAKDVSKVIIQSSVTPISNLKLQKLLYYAQGWFLGLNAGKPLFRENLEAWVHGPVVEPIFQEYRVYGWQSIPKPEGTITLGEIHTRHVRNVVKAYGKYSATELERLSHSEAPWINARIGLAENELSRKVIDHESMRVFFASKARKK